MAIYDNNGTTDYEIGKIYDNNGTTEYQIGKVYDNNGTTDSLIYTAEKVISEGTSTNLWGTPTRTGGYDCTEYQIADGGLNPFMWNAWGDWRDATWTFPNTISTSGYTKLCINYKWKFTGYGLGSVRLLINGTEKANTDWGTTGDAYVSKTLTLDVSGMSSVKLGVLLGCYDSGGGANTFCVITKSWLE